jgi:glycosyltransferase involved in cell wall biosynthesis
VLYRLKWKLARLLKRVLIRWARRPVRNPGPEQVTILLVSAWGMGGTIRAAYNLAGYLADHRDVEIVSIWRKRDEPFFGSFPEGVKVSALDDVRPTARPKGFAGLAYRVLTRLPSVLVHPSERYARTMHNLWTDILMIRRLRGRTGWLITTRPGLNLISAELQLPGLTLIGLEQMHLGHHTKLLRKAMPSRYPKLDAFVVLTDGHREQYRQHLKGKGRIEVIPNTVREMEGPPADLTSKTIFTAGRFFYQKGFELLIDAYAPLAAEHPDWHVRICGHGKLQKAHEEQIARLGVGDAISLEPPTSRIGEDMAAASIFVLSSRFEGFPLILLEAMSKGMAVVAYDCPTGPAEIIRDHENGLLVPAEDVEGLRAALREMIESEELRRRCAPAAVETAERFKMHAIGPRWDALLDDLRR